MCGGGDKGKHKWTVTIVKGTHHQIGIAQSSWNLGGTSSTSLSDKYAFVYSHTSGWNRHRGAATPISANWQSTWDSTNKGKHLTVLLDCAAHTFDVSTEQLHLAKMKYPDSWTTVYAAAAGQSNDHIYTITGPL